MATKTREHRKGGAVEVAERDQRISALRIRGWTYPDIAREVGVSVGTAYQAVQRCLALIRAESAENAVEWREMELQRLDAMWKSLAPKTENGSWVIEKLDRALRIMERRAKLLGLDAPVKQENKSVDGWNMLDWPEDRKDADGAE